MSSFTPSVAVLLILLGVAVGTFGTLVGVGGGILLAPILLVLYPDESPQTITAISLAVVFVNSLAGSIAYGRQRRIDYRSGLVFGAAGVPGSVVGVFLVGLVARRPFDVMFAVLFLAVGLWPLLRPPRVHQPLRGETGRSGRDLTDRFGNRYQYGVRLALGAVFGMENTGSPLTDSNRRTMTRDPRVDARGRAYVRTTFARAFGQDCR